MRVLEEYINNYLECFDKYYDLLTSGEPIEKDLSYNMVLLAFMDDVVNDQFGVLIDEEDYNALNEKVHEIAGEYIFPYDVYKRRHIYNGNPFLNPERITESRLTNFRVE